MEYKESVLLTGASGFIGRKLYLELSKRYNVKVYNRNNPEYPDDIKAVIHLAGIAHAKSSIYNKDDYFNANFKLTKDLCDYYSNSTRSNLTFVFLSTSKVYGDSGIFQETDICEPSSYYAQSKLAAENYLIQKKEFFRLIIIRPALVVGINPKGNLKTLLNLMRYLPIIPIFEGGGKRSYCKLSSLCNFIFETIEKKSISGVFNISENRKLSFSDLQVGLINNFYSKKVKLKISKRTTNILLSFLKILGITVNEKFEEFIVCNSKIKTVSSFDFDSDIFEKQTL